MSSLSVPCYSTQTVAAARDALVQRYMLSSGDDTALGRRVQDASLDFMLLHPENPRKPDFRSMVASFQKGKFYVLNREKGKVESRDQLQWCFDRRNLKGFLDFVGFDDTDTYLSVNEYMRPSRKGQNLLCLRALYVDLDFYAEDSAWKSLVKASDAELASRVRAYCTEKSVPPPSYVKHSGRGLQIFWLFKEGGVPATAKSRYDRAQSSLNSIFKEVGADSGARDASRVVRLAGTTNRKVLGTGADPHCRFIDFELDEGDVHRYSFDELCDRLLPVSRVECKERRKRRLVEAEREKLRKHRPVLAKKKIRSFRGSYGAFAMMAYHDLKKIAELRGGFEEGHRQTALYHLATFGCHAGMTTPEGFSAFVRECEEIVDPSHRWKSNDVTEILNRFKRDLAGETEVYNGRTYPCLYTPRRERIVEDLNISDDELEVCSALCRVADPEERNERRKRRRRKDPEASREAIHARVCRRRAQVRTLLSKGLSQRAISKQLGCALATINADVKALGDLPEKASFPEKNAEQPALQGMPVPSIPQQEEGVRVMALYSGEASERSSQVAPLSLLERSSRGGGFGGRTPPPPDLSLVLVSGPRSARELHFMVKFGRWPKDGELDIFPEGTA